MQASKMSSTENDDVQFPFEDDRNRSFLSGSSLKILILAVEIVVSVQPRGQLSSGLAVLAKSPGGTFLAGPDAPLTDMILLDLVVVLPASSLTVFLLCTVTLKRWREEMTHLYVLVSLNIVCS